MRLVVSAVFGLLLSLPVLAQEPLSRQLSLSEMTQSAGSIVHGQIVSSRIEPHPQYKNITTLRVTLRVLDPIYGVDAKQITYRLFLPPRMGAVLSPPGEYRSGQELVLFMHKESQYGLTSPVGGAQGRFRVEIVDGQRRVVNGLNNSGLFAPLSREAKAQGRQMSAAESAISTREAGAVGLDEFLTVVRQLAGDKVSQ